jgi:hypothetical protein
MANLSLATTIEAPYVYSSSHMIPRWKLTPAVFPPGSQGAQISSDDVPATEQS